VDPGPAGAGPVGLRERKKRETRTRIADAAMRLFAEQGFDQTTVAEVAVAADVSVKTVFNYFPAKEDLFFDQADEVEQRWLDAVADRTPDDRPLAGLRRKELARFADHPGGVGARFQQVMAASALLQARGQQMWASHEDAIARALAGQLGYGPADPAPQIIAHQVMAIYPLAQRMARVWAEQGASPAQTRDRATELINHAFDILEHGLAAWRKRLSRPSGGGRPSSR
jgi:AcrR family transcriptional regulator